MSEQSVLEIHNLYKSFGKLEVLKGISLQVGAGEVIAVIGSSGSGKSTMLRCINLLEKPDSGDIIFLGKRIDWATRSLVERQKAKKDIQELRSKIGIVFQAFNLWYHKTALENIIEAPIHVLGIPKREAIAKADELLKRFGLEDKRDVYPLKLSGGQQQRVAITRALAMSPTVMLFDEVTSALDPELTGEVLDAMKLLAQDGMTMIVVTHEISFAKAASDRTIFIDEGEILEAGPSEQMLSRPEKQRTREFLKRVLHEAKEKK